MIYHLFFVDSHGDIRVVKPPKGLNNPDHLSFDVNGHTVIHHMSEISDLNNFVNTKYWNFTDGVFNTRTSRPNRHAVWENGTWNWNSSKLLDDVRTERNNKLLKCDWTQLPDSPLSTDMKNTWAGYRQELRDITNVLDEIESLDDVVWPTEPE